MIDHVDKTCRRLLLLEETGTFTEYGRARIRQMWSAELANQFGTPHPAATWRGTAVNVRERSLRGEDAVLLP